MAEARWTTTLRVPAPPPELDSETATRELLEDAGSRRIERVED